MWTAVNVLEQCCREELDAEAQRRFVVVDPVKVTLTNVAGDFVEHVMLPNNPRDESAGKRSVALCSTLYLERADFREDGAEDKDFYGLAPGKTVMLRCVRALQLTVSQRNITLDFICSYAFHISCTGVKKDAAGKVIHLHLHLLVNNTGMFANFCRKIIEILASKVEEGPKKVKGVLHWVSSASPSVAPRRAELRMCPAPALVPFRPTVAHSAIFVGMICCSRAKTRTSARIGLQTLTPAVWRLVAPFPCAARPPHCSLRWCAMP